ncbi:MAG: hypothetical protein HKM23_00350 [Nitrosopumilus sp.]|nr:hypothetical protein [Nitrosopumilus sp.]NNL59691.1 hypothetical protein [Nitrosopumilus sp.]
MDILMGLVIAMFIITAVYVGFHASEKPVEAGGHDISLELDILNQGPETIQILKINEFKKIVI